MASAQARLQANRLNGVGNFGTAESSIHREPHRWRLRHGCAGRCPGVGSLRRTVRCRNEPTGLNALNAMHRETRNELGVYGLPTSAMMLARTVTLSPLGSRWSMTETETGSTRFATVPGETPEVSLCSPAA
jgi:hypothetical protein